MSTDNLTIALIAAVAANGIIGRDGEMPWHLPADLDHFKQTTMDHPVVMGRRTYDSIASQLGGPLPGRTNIVLSRSDPELGGDVVVVDSIDAAIDAASAAEKTTETVYIIGGATVYEQFLPQADRLVLTELEASYEGDTAFPAFDHTVWEEVDREERDGFAFVTYERQ